LDRIADPRKRVVTAVLKGLQPMAVAAGAIGRATSTVKRTIAEYASNEAYARDTAALVRWSTPRTARW
jgi:hypothetical protein